MARGWESKAVADQIDQADARETNSRAAVNASPAARAHHERFLSLKLSRARILAQLECARLPVHRQLLNRTLRALEAEIEELNATDLS